MSDNVTPITQTHVCSSCLQEIPTMRKHEGHSETCMQPEIRMRRAERQVAQLTEVVHQLVASNNEAVTNQIDLNKRLESLFADHEKLIGAYEYLLALKEPAKETNASTPSPDAEPSTQRSPILEPGDGLSERSLAILWEGPNGTLYRASAYADPGAGESPGEAPAGAEPAGGSERGA